MQYCIYKGDICNVTNEDNNLVWIIHDGDPLVLGKDAVIPISDEKYKEIESEYMEIRKEIDSVISRRSKLDDEYYRKKEALSELLMKARQREITMINRLIRAVPSEQG